MENTTAAKLFEHCQPGPRQDHNCEGVSYDRRSRCQCACHR